MNQFLERLCSGAEMSCDEFSYKVRVTVDNRAAQTLWFLIEREETAPLDDTEFIDDGNASPFETHN